MCMCACMCVCERVCLPASQMFLIFNSPFAPLDLQESMRFCRSSLPPYRRALPHYLFVSSRRFTWPLMSTFPEGGNAGFAPLRRRHPSCPSSDLKCFQSVLLSRNLSAFFVPSFFSVFLSLFPVGVGVTKPLGFLSFFSSLDFLSSFHSS